MTVKQSNVASPVKCTDALLIFGSIYISATCLSLARASGVLFVAILEEYQVSTATTGWVMSIFAGLLLGAGVISGHMCAYLGAPVTALLGTFVLSTGMLACAFVHHIYVMYVTFGVIGGFGSSLTLVSVHVLIQQNFEKRRALAASLASLGIGAGAMLLPQLHTVVLVEAGLRETFYVISGLCYSACLVSVMFMCISFKKKNKVDNITKDKDSEAQTTKMENSEKEGRNLPRSCCTGYDFISAKFVSCLISVFLGAFAVFVPLNLLPALLAHRGMPPDQISTVVACAGPGDIIGKIVIGLIADYRRIDRSLYMVFSMLVLGFMTVASMFFHHMYQFICYSAIYGLASGVWTFLQPVITMDIVGADNMAHGFGLVCMFQGAAATVGLPAAGWLVDNTASFNTSFLTSGIFFLLSAVTALYFPMHRKRGRTDSIATLTDTCEVSIVDYTTTKCDTNS